MKLAPLVLALTVAFQGAACYPAKPYVNPVPTERLQRLGVAIVAFDSHVPSNVRGAHFTPYVDLYKAAARQAVIERLGDRFDSRGADAIVLRLEMIDIEGVVAEPTSVTSKISATLRGPGMVGTYSVGPLTTGAIQTEEGTLAPPDRLVANARDEAYRLSARILGTDLQQRPRP